MNQIPGNTVANHPAYLQNAPQYSNQSQYGATNQQVQSQPVMTNAAMLNNKAQLWQMIERIGEQFEQIQNNQAQGSSRRSGSQPQVLDQQKFNLQHNKLQRLIVLRKKCLEAEKSMREKQLALMRERNLYLEKCRQIEEYGESIDWGGDPSYDEDFNDRPKMSSVDQILMQEVYDILYTEK